MTRPQSRNSARLAGVQRSRRLHWQRQLLSWRKVRRGSCAIPVVWPEAVVGKPVAAPSPCAAPRRVLRLRPRARSMPSATIRGPGAGRDHDEGDGSYSRSRRAREGSAPWLIVHAIPPVSLLQAAFLDVRGELLMPILHSHSHRKPARLAIFVPPWQSDWLVDATRRFCVECRFVCTTGKYDTKGFARLCASFRHRCPSVTDYSYCNLMSACKSAGSWA